MRPAAGSRRGDAGVAGRRLKVALDGEPLLGRTGVGNFCHELLRLLADRSGAGAADVDVYAVTWSRRAEIERRLWPGVRLVGRPAPARLLRRTWQAGVGLPLEWLIGAYDVVHGTNFVVPPTRRAARVVTVHDLTPLRYPEMCRPGTLAFPGLVRRAVATGAWVHTHTEAVAAEVVDAFGAHPERVRAIPPGIPPLPPPAPDAPRPPGCDRYVLAVGTVEPRKDYPGLLTAFDAVAERHPDVGLVLAGGDGWGAEEFSAALDRSAHRERVLRLGYVDDARLAALLEGAAVLAFPSRYEGFGFPPLQAMAARVPVVATAVPAVAEVVGDAAVVVPVGDTDALAGALDTVLGDAGAASALAVAGAARAAGFSWRRCADSMAALYSDAAGQV